MLTVEQIERMRPDDHLEDMYCLNRVYRAGDMRELCVMALQALAPPLSAERAVRHVGECATDECARQVCDEIYRERVDNVLGLLEGLRAIMALCGDDPQIRKIIEDTIAEHAGGLADD